MIALNNTKFYYPRKTIIVGICNFDACSLGLNFVFGPGYCVELLYSGRRYEFIEFRMDRWPLEGKQLFKIIERLPAK